ncbi:SDR family oxidoreductase [Streptomyces sp.]|uniref:SDR family oxidoreductase n=1 Tax=Streptomyces sp. TaxID=1931 RepID=UPI002F95729C
MQRVAQRAGAPPSIVAVLDSLRVPEGAQALTGSAGLDVEQIAVQRTRNPAAALHANITGNQTVLDAAARHHRTVQRLVFVSSASFYGLGTGAATFHEDQPLLPGSVYSNTKLWGEHQTALTLSGDTDSHAIVRYFSVYGEPQVIKENSHSWVVAWFAMRAALGLPLHLNGGGTQVRDFVHVEDIAYATLLAADRPRLCTPRDGERRHRTRHDDPPHR